MSMERHYYVIAGYDLTGYETDKFDDWKWSEEGEEYTCSQCKGEIQLFIDPVSGNYLYLGFILADGDEYDFGTEEIEVGYIVTRMPYVRERLEYLQKIDVISKEIPKANCFKVIVFEEDR